MHTEVAAHLLQQTELTVEDLANSFSHFVTSDVDYADLYCQQTEAESWVLENQIIKSGAYAIDKGFGLRCIKDSLTGFAYADSIDAGALKNAATSASKACKYKQSSHEAVTYQSAQKALSTRQYDLAHPLANLERQHIIDALFRIDSLARNNTMVQEVIASAAMSHEHILVLNTLDEISADIRPLVRLNVTVVLNKDGQRESASYGGGGRFPLSDLLQEETLKAYTDEAIRQAEVNLRAIDAPAGTQTVVLGAGWPGVMLHEAVGHGLEGDFNRKGTSTYSGQVGQQVASDKVTIVDNGAMDKRRGSLTVDDEGTPTQETVLIENGVLRAYMQDRHNAALMGQSSTGNGRRESYSHLPMPRMTNTYMLAGEHSPEEIIASVDHGIYAVNFSGGQVDITSGQFVFSASEAYLIENGKVTHPVKGLTLIGNGPEAMQQVSMVGNDLALDNGVGVCGKDGQSVPVGVGQPTLKIDAMTVGGTQV